MEKRSVQNVSYPNVFSGSLARFHCIDWELVYICSDLMNIITIVLHSDMTMNITISRKRLDGLQPVYCN